MLMTPARHRTLLLRRGDEARDARRPMKQRQRPAGAIEPIDAFERRGECLLLAIQRGVGARHLRRQHRSDVKRRPLVRERARHAVAAARPFDAAAVRREAQPTRISYEISLQQKRRRGAAPRCIGSLGCSLHAEPQVGIEPTTARLRIECSTPELLWQVLQGACAGPPQPARSTNRSNNSNLRTRTTSKGAKGACRHALARTRTVTPFGTTPSRWRVYQFHHQGQPHYACSLATSSFSYQFGYQNSRIQPSYSGPNRFHCELSNTGATGLEPATSRVTVECSNQTELPPPVLQ